MALIKKYSENTTISGIGNAENRINEITGDELAVFRNFAIGYKDGVLKHDNHDFNYSINKHTIHITDGTCFAYGYFAYCQAKDFVILPPTVESYFIIYIRLDKSVIPNTAELLIKNNYSSPNIGTNSFRQDVLSTIKTGVYEIPLWIFKVTNKGIDSESFKLLPQPRNKILREHIVRTEYSDSSLIVQADGYLENGTIAATQPITDNSEKIATTAFVQAAIQAEINK